MTGPAESTGAAEPAEPGGASGSTPSAQPSERRTRGPGRFFGGSSRRRIGWLACGVAVGLVIFWFVALSHWAVGSKAEWFFGAAAFAAVAVALSQSTKIQRQANHDAREAAERLRRELCAAEARSASERAHARELHRVELDAQRKLHRIELDAQKELARIQRAHLLELQQRQAVAAVSRAVGAHTQMLATLWNQHAKILGIADRAGREQAIDVIMEQLGRVVQDVSAELGNAHMLIEDERLHEALDRVNAAAMKAVVVAEDVRVAVVDGHEPDSNPIPRVQDIMHQSSAQARGLAAELLQTGLDDN